MYLKEGAVAVREREDLRAELQELLRGKLSDVAGPGHEAALVFEGVALFLWNQTESHRNRNTC